jgi:hypothetical protein
MYKMFDSHFPNTCTKETRLHYFFYAMSIKFVLLFSHIVSKSVLRFAQDCLELFKLGSQSRLERLLWDSSLEKYQLF